MATTKKHNWQDVRDSIRGALKTLAALELQISNGGIQNPFEEIFGKFNHEKSK